MRSLRKILPPIHHTLEEHAAMSRSFAFWLLSALPLLLLATFSVADDTSSAKVLDFKVKDIDGGDVNLAQYKGDVLLVVNTASKCGYTPQYEGLETIYEKYKDKGFKVLAFPANEFGKQEPGTDQEIKEVCKPKFNGKFQV